MKSRVMRIPYPESAEIEKIAREYKISLGAAFKIWNNRRLNIKWKDV